MEGHPKITGDWDSEDLAYTKDNAAAKIINNQQRPVVLGEVTERTPTGSIRPLQPANDIDRENKLRISRMSPEEILAEQEELKKTLPPKLLQRFTNRK